PPGQRMPPGPRRGEQRPGRERRVDPRAWWEQAGGADAPTLAVGPHRRPRAALQARRHEWHRARWSKMRWPIRRGDCGETTAWAHEISSYCKGRQRFPTITRSSGHTSGHGLDLERPGSATAQPVDPADGESVSPPTVRDPRPKWRNGRRSGLKIRRPKGREGSSPYFGPSKHKQLWQLGGYPPRR